jgi:hypothetical protein
MTGRLPALMRHDSDFRSVKVVTPVGTGSVGPAFVYVEFQLDSGREVRSTAASEPPQGPQDLVPEAR